MRAGASVLLVTNAHFQPDQTLRNLRERLRRIAFHWPVILKVLGIITGDFNICDPEEGRYSVRNQTFTEGDVGKTALLRTGFPHALEIAQPNITWKDTAADGTLRTLSRIDRAFINVPMAETRDFDNLGERSIPSDHVTVRIVVQKQSSYCGAVNCIPSWMAKHPVFLHSSEADR